MPTPNTRDKEEAKKSNVVMPKNPFFPYDTGIFQMIKKLYDETYYVDTYENAFKINAKAHQGKVVLPMISVCRLGDYSIATEALNDWAVRSGFRSNVYGSKAEFPDQRVAIHTLPVSLQYQIDVWATRRDVADGITAELVLEFEEHPHFKIKIQDTGLDAIPVEFDFQVDDNVVDNSSITEFEDTGRFYRLTLTGNVPMAAIFRVDIFNRVDKEIIHFITEKEEEEPVKPKAKNKITHVPEDTLIVDNFLYGETVEDEVDHTDNA